MSQDESLLLRDASDRDRWHAIRLNVESWYERSSLAAPKQHITRISDVLLTPEHATIPDEASLQNGALIDHILDWYRSRPGSHSTIIWYLGPSPPSVELEAKLLARGVSTNWAPHWMWCDLTELPRTNLPDSAVDVRMTGANGLNTSEGNPAACDEQAPTAIWHVTAFHEGTEVGRCDVNFTYGQLRVGGVFDMFVDSEHRRRGIGTALVNVCLNLAQTQGCHHMYLNSTDEAESLYRKQGFQSLGRGTTWHLRENFNKTATPGAYFVSFLEALGAGRIADLEVICKGVTLDDMQRRTINTMTPLELTVHLRQQQAASWLINHGVIPDVMSLWDLGLKDQAAQLLVDMPDEVNRKRGDHNGTPLHTAVARDDVELARVLLDVPRIDLDIKDDVFHATPLNWADFLQSANVLALLRQRST